MTAFQFAIPALLLLFCLMQIYGALSDLSTFRIPNWVSYGLVLLFAVFVFVNWLNTPYMPSMQFRLPMWAWNVFVGIFVFVVTAVFWKLGHIGGGDVKFLTATSLWMGIERGVYFMLMVSVFALIFLGGIKFLAFWNAWFQASPSVPAFVKRLIDNSEQRKLPYGFPIAVAALMLAPGMFRI